VVRATIKTPIIERTGQVSKIGVALVNNHQTEAGVGRQSASNIFSLAIDSVAVKAVERNQKAHAALR